MDENEFTADEAEKINEWGQKTLEKARLKEAPRRNMYCPDCKSSDVREVTRSLGLWVCMKCHLYYHP